MKSNQRSISGNGKATIVCYRFRKRIVELLGDLPKVELFCRTPGSVPEIDIKLEKIIFFMYQPKFQKIYFCGKYNLKKITKSNIDKFYTNLCFNGTKKFIGFNELDR